LEQTIALSDSLRQTIAPQIAQAHKSKFGQFMTPSSVAMFMADMFSASSIPTCRLLDAGAGMGALTSAFLDRWKTGKGLMFDRVESEVHEIDPKLRLYLEDVLAAYREDFGEKLKFSVFDADFIEHAVTNGLLGIGGRYTHAILNPPYKKINSGSDHRLIMRRLGIEAVNLYSAFVALALELMQPHGQIVAIIPRSFCNGPYYRPFRDMILDRSAILRIHLFASRTKAFKDDDVLQENVIIHLERGATQGDVAITTSTDDSFCDIECRVHPFNRIVFPDDPERFIHVPTSTERGVLESSHEVRYSLDDIGIALSTGPVVDFRLKEHIVPEPVIGSAPLLYASHFVGQDTQWPSAAAKRGNAIMLNSETEKWLYPKGFYTVVRRFSSKEEKRRLVAGVVQPSSFPDADKLGFENHLNVFHDRKTGLDEDLAYGLAAFINSTAADDHFRRFNGHTQVNATDLRLMRYPSRAKLATFGKWARGMKALTQDMIDRQLTILIA
jgi:tRNA1(Val) A37 N6-methylase TrmN6